jgi:hypothetical protein
MKIGSYTRLNFEKARRELKTPIATSLETLPIIFGRGVWKTHFGSKYYKVNRENGLSFLIVVAIF